MFTAASTGNLSKEEAVAYSASYYKELDNQSAIRFAERKGREEGILKIARNMKFAGMSASLIGKMTGLSASAIENL